MGGSAGLGRRRRLKAGRFARAEQLLEPRCPAAIELAEDQLIHRRVADRARLGTGTARSRHGIRSPTAGPRAPAAPPTRARL